MKASISSLVFTLSYSSGDYMYLRHPDRIKAGLEGVRVITYKRG